MEKFLLFREEALKNYRLADHMLNVTYPLLQDTKLLLGITHNLFLALSQAMSAILHHEMLFKLAPSLPDTFEGRLHLLRQRCAARHQISPEYFDLILELKEIVCLHRLSPVEFRRKDRFIICTNNYKIHPITTYQLKNYLKKTQDFLKLMNQITSQHEELFKK